MSIKNTVFSRTHEALRNLVLNSIDIQLEIGPTMKKVSSPRSWVKEFCTVRFCGPRQSGHTTSMISVGQELFRQPAFLFPFEDMRRRTLAGTQNHRGHFLTLAESELVGINPSSIFVDCASFSTGGLIERLYITFENRVMGGAEPFCFVFIQ